MSSAAKNIHTLRDFERWLRKHGFSRAAATTIASHGYRPLLRNQNKAAGFDVDTLFKGRDTTG